MAGFYVHIPFCKQVCYYCNFHFVATLKYKDEMFEALLLEIKNRSKDWENTIFKTLYLGGGTPSILSVSDLNKLIEVINKYYNFSEKIEFTLEANPDDLTPAYLQELRDKTSINRLSIGTQSFHEKDLKLMNRRHSGIEALESIQNAQKFGFNNINVDLIYGTPGLTNKQWDYNLSKFIELKVPHLSAYHMTFEPKTVFEHMRKKNEIVPVNEDLSQQQYEILVNRLKENGFLHYEISNFARKDFFSEHNTNYWLRKPYLGIGPSAHSFMEHKRRWNISNNTKYCKSFKDGNTSYFTEEDLSVPSRYNEYMITSLRTFWGIKLECVRQMFGDLYVEHTLDVLKKFNIKEHYSETQDGFSLTEKGWLISDYIIREFMFEE